MAFIERLFWKLYIRFRLYQLEKTYGSTEWDITPALLITLVWLLPDALLVRYTRQLGVQIPLNTAFTNAEHVLTWLDRMIRTINEGECLDYRLMVDNNNRRTVVLDDFLVNYHGGSVTPSTFCDRLLPTLYLLEKTLHEHPVSDMRQYYERKLRVSLNDIFLILEGLLKAAMNA